MKLLEELTSAPEFCFNTFGVGSAFLVFTVIYYQMRLAGYLFFFNFNFFIHMCIKCLGHFSPLPPPPPLPTSVLSLFLPPPGYLAETICPYL
jgi:hypothetical protein